MKFYQQKYFKPYHKIATDFNQTDYSPTIEYNYFDRSDHRPQQRYQSPSRYNDESYVPSFQRSNIKHIRPQRTVTQPIWQHLYNQGVKSQKQLLQRHKNNQHKIDTECTFQPILRSNRRYLVASSSSFLERVGVWQQHKIQKMVKQKQEEVNKDLKQCTFTPQINERSKRNREQVLQRADVRLQKSQNQLRERNRNINPYYSPIKQRKKTVISSTSPIKQSGTGIELSLAKQMIRSQLKRINF